MLAVKNDTSPVLSYDSYENSLAYLLAKAGRLKPTRLPLIQSIGHALAQDIKAAINVPSFDNSAMDGFAFCSDDVASACTKDPVSLSVKGASIAGQVEPVTKSRHGHAIKIMTGAPLPPGTDTILPVEAASWEAETLTFTEPYPANKHVRKVGEDMKVGTQLLKQGQIIQTHHLPVLSAAGVGSIPVFPRVKAVWISTGQELIDDLEMPLSRGQIYNATRLYGIAQMEKFGVDIINAVTVKDTFLDFRTALNAARQLRPDLILTTGGVSAGQYDFVRPVLEHEDAEIHLHKVRIKPGKPVLFATLPEGTAVFGLPGNPVSTALGMKIFVIPYVRTMQGLPPEKPVSAKLTKDCKGASGRTTFLMGQLDMSADGQLKVTPLTGQHSFQTATYAKANCWVRVPEGDGSIIPENSLLATLPF